MTKAAAMPWRTAVELVTPEQRALLWEAGHLFWLLHGDQARVYAEYRRWEDESFDRDGQYKRVFVMDCSRRWGKDRFCLQVKTEDAIRRPGSIHIYATAFAKDINEIVIPLMAEILETCPMHLRPKFQTTHMGGATGYYFPNGSVIKLVGIDKNPDGLRGRGSDGGVITEAAYVKKLEHAVVKVIYPQFQGRPHARLILQSTAPDTPHTDYDMVFLKDAKKRRAWAFRTIEDNPLLSDEEREEFIDAAGGRESDTAQREYFNVRVRDAKKALVPEFDPLRHVRKGLTPPEWADTYSSGDPGMRDLFGLIWGYWDAPRQKLCIQRAWAQRNASTSLVALVWRGTEMLLWGSPFPSFEDGRVWGDKELKTFSTAIGMEFESWAQVESSRKVRWWNGTEVIGPPYARYSDTDIRFLGDMSTDHLMEINCVDKTYSKEVSLYYLREWFENDWIEIDEDGASLLIEHLQEGKWNEHRTDYMRSEEYGHFDLIDALRYLVRHIDRERIPKPPAHVLDPTLQRAIFTETASPQATAMNNTFAKAPPWHGRRRR